MKITDHMRMAEIFYEVLDVGKAYRLMILIQVLRDNSPRFRELSNHYLRTLIGQVTDIGVDKVSLHSVQFIAVKGKKRNALRIFLGTEPTELEKEHYRRLATKQQRDVVEGKVSSTKSRARRSLRGKGHCHVIAKAEIQGWICGICGMSIFPAHYGHIELDHVVPLSAGGEDSLDNIRAVHHFCNNTLSDFGNDDLARRKLIEEGHPVNREDAMHATLKAISKEVKEMVRSVKQPSRQPQEAPRKTEPQVDEDTPPTPPKRDLAWYVDQFASNISEDDRKNSSPAYQYNQFLFWLADKKGNSFVDTRKQEGRLSLELFIPLIEKHLYQPEKNSPPKNPHVRTGRRLGWKDGILQRKAERKEKLRAWKEERGITDTDEEEEEVE